MNQLKEQLREHVEKKIMEASLDLSPFPHIVIENFFPQDVFDRIMKKNPFANNRGKEWIKKSESKNHKTGTPYHARKQINFHENDHFEAEEEDAEFWESIKQCFLTDNWFERLVMTKYSEYFTLRFGDFIYEPDFFDSFRRELFLQRHEPGYFIGPHTDVPTRVFTCIFSFAEKEGFEEFGTELCVHKDPKVRCWGNNHYAPDDFVVKKVAPYKPNNFLLFFKTRHSFHSVKAIDDTVPNQRYGMQFQFYEPKGGIFSDLSEPDLMLVRHNKKQSKIREILSVLAR